MTAAEQRLSDMPNARLRARLVRLAVPAMFGSLIGMSAQFMVIVLLGRMGEEALYVRSLYTPIALTFIAVQMAIEVANQVATAVAFGRNDYEKLGAIAGASIKLGLLALGLVATAVAAFAPLMAGALGASGHSHDTLVEFVRWMSLAIMPHIGSIVLASGLRGCRRTATAAVNSTTVALTQVGGVILFGNVLGMGLFGMPLAIATAGLVGTCMGWLGWRRHGIGQVRIRAWRRDAFPQFFGVGVPVAGGLLLNAAANMVALWTLSPFGPDVVSAFAAAVAAQNVVVVPAIALGSATSIMMNNVRGEGRTDRLRDLLRVAAQIAVSAYAVIALTGWLLRSHIGQIVSESPDVINEMTRYFGIISLSYVAAGVLFMLLAVLEQLKFGVFALLSHAAYHCSILAIGGTLARSTGQVDDYYIVTVAANIAWSVPALALGMAAVKRVHRKERARRDMAETEALAQTLTKLAIMTRTPSTSGVERTASWRGRGGAK